MRRYFFVEEPDEDMLFQAFRHQPVAFVLEDEESGDLQEVTVTRFTALQHGEAGSIHFTGYTDTGASITGFITGEGSSEERSSVVINP